MQAKIKALKNELIKRMHEPIREVGKWLTKVVAGHNQYYGVPGNYAALNSFRYRVSWTWRRVLMRRSQKGYVTWEKMQPIIDRWLPKPRICHPYPSERFGVRT